MKQIDPRFLLGFGILAVLTVLSLLIALGSVKQESSYGLEIVLGSLATLCGAFSQWAFSKQKEVEDKKP